MFGVGYYLRGLLIKSERPTTLLSPLGLATPVPANPYPPYSFAALRQQQLSAQPISVEKQLPSEPAWSSYLVSWEVPNLSTHKNERVTGQLNVPLGKGPFPIIVMVRGYVERDQYQTGTGTKNAAAALARNGYITIAPDFLGYGGSDPESNDVLIARFARPLVVMQLLKDLSQLQLRTASTDTAAAPAINGGLFQPSRIGLWGHSNGGQIALSVLEITSLNLPTTLWAPVSKPFPFSILYFSDENPDGGWYIRQQLAKFEYILGNKVADYSILSEPARILAPIQVHQGGTDESVPLAWSQQLVQTLQAATVSAKLYTYPKSNHNLQPDWDTVVRRDLEFFAKYLK
jgi:dipeptidyl aminopeptidase/acylaminoacyl peptidase